MSLLWLLLSWLPAPALAADAGAMSLPSRAAAGGGAPPIPDILAAELALNLARVELRSATAASAWSDGETVHLAWVDLVDGRTRLQLSGRADRRLCTPTTNIVFWGGGRQVVSYTPSAGRAEDVAGVPSLILVDGHPRVGAAVAISPGDTLTVTGVRKKGDLEVEVLELTRVSGTLHLERRPEGEKLCYLPPDVAT